MPGLRRDVVRLAGAAVEQEAGRGVDQPPVGGAVFLRLRAPVPARGPRHHERPAQVHADHVVPFVVGEVEHHPRSAESRVVDDDVEPAPRFERERTKRVAHRRVADVAAVRDASPPAPSISATTSAAGIFVGGAAVGRDARVVHDHAGPVRGQAQCVRTPDAATGAGDEGDTLTEVDHAADPR